MSQGAVSESVSTYSRCEPAESQGLVFPTIMVLFSCICFGLVPFFAKSLTEAGVASSMVPFYRYTVSAVIFLPCIVFAKVNYREVGWGLLAGASMGIGWISYVNALNFVSVSAAAVIYMTYPMFAILIAWLWFREVPKTRSLAATVIIFFAASLTISDFTHNKLALSALLMSLLAPFGFGVCINILVFKLKTLSSMAKVSSLSIGAVLSLSFVVIPLGVNQIMPPSAYAWVLLVGIAVLTATLPQLIYTAFAPKLGTARVAIAGSIELPTMFVVGWLAFAEQITLPQYISAALVFYSIYLTADMTKRRAPKRYRGI